MIKILLLFLSWIMLCLIGVNVMYMTATRVWEWEYVTGGTVAILFGLMLFALPIITIIKAENYWQLGGDY